MQFNYMIPASAHPVGSNGTSTVSTTLKSFDVAQALSQADGIPSLTRGDQQRPYCNRKDAAQGVVIEAVS